MPGLLRERPSVNSRDLLESDESRIWRHIGLALIWGHVQDPVHERDMAELIDGGDRDH
jgi:hypothetical protein